MKKITPSQSHSQVQNIDRRHVLPTFLSFAVGAYAAYQITTVPPRPPEPVFITSRMGDHEVYVNTQKIRWMQHNPENDCFYLCTDDHGCFRSLKVDDKYLVCSKEYPKSYKKLDKLVQSTD